MLRYLFSNLIAEEIKRDEIVRQSMIRERQGSIQRSNAPPSIALPAGSTSGWSRGNTGPPSATTPKATNGRLLPTTPGLNIGLATPGVATTPSNSLSTTHSTTLGTTSEEGAVLEKTISSQSHPQSTADKSSSNGIDYFSTANGSRAATTPGGTNVPRISESQDDSVPLSPSDEKAGKEGFFGGKKFRMAFGMKKAAKDKPSEAAEKPLPTATEEKAEDSDSRSSKTEDRVVEDCFLGLLQKIRHAYEDYLDTLPADADAIPTGITPSLPNDTPVLKPPANTTILIQEDRPDSGGVADLFEGQVGTIARQADLIEKVAPMWLGEALLRVCYLFFSRRSSRH